MVFEPNDELLWVRVKRTIDVFLNTVWRSGALAGGSPAEAFFVNVGRETMTQDDIDNGRPMRNQRLLEASGDCYLPYGSETRRDE